MGKIRRKQILIIKIVDIALYVVLTLSLLAPFDVNIYNGKQYHFLTGINYFGLGGLHGLFILVLSINQLHKTHLYGAIVLGSIGCFLIGFSLISTPIFNIILNEGSYGHSLTYFYYVGLALWITSTILVAGFLVLYFSIFTATAQMGIMISIIVICALITDFFLLPPLLMKLEETKS